MNIVDAWKELDKGNDIECVTRKIYSNVWKNQTLNSFLNYACASLSENELKSNTWEIFKKPTNTDLLLEYLKYNAEMTKRDITSGGSHFYEITERYKLINDNTFITVVYQNSEIIK